MGSAIAKDLNGNIVRANLFFNDNGVIKNVDNFDRYVDNGGVKYKMPQKENLVLNFDALTFSTNSIRDASTDITNQFTLSQAGTQKTDFGTITQSTPSGNSYQVDTLNKTWYIPDINRTVLNYGQNILTNQRFTVALTCKFRGTPANYRDLTWFNNPSGLRIEWNGSQIEIFGENSLGVPSARCSRLANYTNFFQIIMVANGTSLIVYQNGVKEVDVTMGRVSETGNGDSIYLFTQRGGSASLGFGSAVELKHLQIWKTNLTEQEVSDLRKYLFLS